MSWSEEDYQRHVAAKAEQKLTPAQLKKLRQAERDKSLAIQPGAQVAESPKTGVTPRKPRARPQQEEHRQQAILFSRVKRWEGAYPELLLAYAVPNGSSSQQAKMTRIYMAAEGLRAGMPDVNVDVSRTYRGNLYHGLRIEMKRPGEKPREEQEVIHSCLMGQGYLVAVMQDGLQAWALVAEYLGLPRNLWV